MADQDHTLAQNDDATPQDQFKPARSQFGQNSPTPGATDIKGASGQQGQGQPADEASMSGSTTAGYGQTGFTGEMGGSGQIAGNDQAGGGLGQNHSGYGGENAPGSNAAGEAAQDAQQQARQSVGTRSDSLGPDLSKGTADGDRGGGS